MLLGLGRVSEGAFKSTDGWEVATARKGQSEGTQRYPKGGRSTSRVSQSEEKGKAKQLFLTKTTL